MTAADSKYVITCPNCSARFAVAASMAGRRGRCAACEAAFTIPANDAESAPIVQAAKSSALAAPAKPDRPKFVSVECRVCGTRLTGLTVNVGKKVKCPDCGAGTVLPEPPVPKAPKKPAALEGEQYELWDPDDQPLPSELLAMQPKYIAITCRQCGTLMQANEIQVGQQIACPDCGTKQVVPVAPKPVVKTSVLAPDSQTPTIDLDSLPGDRPNLVAHTMGLTLPEQKAQRDYDAALEESRRTGRRMKLDVRGRPVLPRFPLLTSILSFPFTPGVLTRWATLTLGLLMWFGLIIDGVPSWVNWNGSGSGAISAMGGLVETLIASVIAIIWFAGLSSIVVAIISQSAVGADRIEDWPSLNFIHSISEMLPVSVAVVFTAAPGWALGKLVFDDLAMSGLLAAITMLLGLPLVLLSQLAGNYTWELVDLKVLGAMVRCPFSMLLFYLQSALLLAASASAMFFLGRENLYLTLLAAPLVAFSTIIYARLLGRLGWRVSEKIVVDEPDEEDRPSAPRNYNPPRPKKAPV